MSSSRVNVTVMLHARLAAPRFAVRTHFSFILCSIYEHPTAGLAGFWFVSCNCHSFSIFFPVEKAPKICQGIYLGFSMNHMIAESARWLEEREEPGELLKALKSLHPGCLASLLAER